MIDVKNLQIELKVGAFLGLSALVLSLLTGVIAGIPAGITILRAFVAMLIFTGIGYGAVTVLKKFVPEIGDIKTGALQEGEEPEAKIEEYSADEGDSTSPVGEFSEVSAENFTELNTDEIPRVQPGESEFDPTSDLSVKNGTEGAVNPSAGKLGKHIIANEEQFKYEPKLMAEAVRTMMSKDEE